MNRVHGAHIVIKNAHATTVLPVTQRLENVPAQPDGWEQFVMRSVLPENMGKTVGIFVDVKMVGVRQGQAFDESENYYFVCRWCV